MLQLFLNLGVPTVGCALVFFGLFVAKEKQALKQGTILSGVLLSGIGTFSAVTQTTTIGWIIFFSSLAIAFGLGQIFPSFGRYWFARREAQRTEFGQ